MLTESQKRALRAKTLLDSGMDAKEAAKKCGYKGVNGMLGAIALCEKSIQKKEDVFDGSLRSPQPDIRPDEIGIQAIAPEKHVQRHDGFHAKCVIVDEMHLAKPMPMVTAKLKTKIYPIEDGIITIAREMVSVTYKPENRTVHINNNLCKNPAWVAFVGHDRIGGKPALARAMRQIAEAAIECAELIESEG